MSWELIFYRQDGGDMPVRSFLRALPKAVRTEAGAAIADLEEFGPNLRRPDADYLQDGIYELRFRWERVEYRILYFFDGAEVVLTNGFVKKTMEVPSGEIERAVKRRSRWLARG